MNKHQQQARERLGPSGTGARARRIRGSIFLGTEVKVDRRGNGIPVHTYYSVPEPNGMRPPTGNRERARRLRQQERRNASA